jgi:hypothetical protein
MAMGIGGKRGTISEINMTPMIDVLHASRAAGVQVVGLVPLGPGAARP